MRRDGVSNHHLEEKNGKGSGQYTDALM